MSLVNNFDLNDYETVDDVLMLLSDIECELSILRGYQRGAHEKLCNLEQKEEED